MPRLKISDCKMVNDLWIKFLNNIGTDKATRAVKQAIDLKKMYGNDNDLPVLYTSTGGIGLTTFHNLKNQIGIKLEGNDKVLLYNHIERQIQILNDRK